MQNITQFNDFVNGQVKFHEQKAAVFDNRSAKFPQEKFRADKHRQMAEQFSGLLTYMASLASKPKAVGMKSRVGLTPEEIDGLPPELIEELSISEADKADFAVLTVVDEAGGVLSLDKILIALYRKTGEVNKRATLNARIYRMVQRGSMFNVPGRKGVYATRELTDEEAASLS